MATFRNDDARVRGIPRIKTETPEGVPPGGGTRRIQESMAGTRLCHDPRRGPQDIRKIPPGGPQASHVVRPGNNQNGSRNMSEWKWHGARWWKFDFHTHTPASNDYGKGPDQEALKARTERDWLLDFMAAEIDCVAVTDHNTGAWIDRLKEALNKLDEEKPDGYRNLQLFPGMEISVHGNIHLLAIFDPSVSTSDLDALRGAVEYEGTPGESDRITKKTFADVAEIIVNRNGIVIPAHVDKANGLFQYSGNTLKQALDCDQVFAMEIVEPTSQKPTLYYDKGLHWAEVLGSDSHHPHGGARQRYPGSYFTWVKMGEPSIEGLRLALLDGNLSLRRSDQEVNNPNHHTTLALESIEVNQARYLGRSRVFKLGFNPWLNAIIGGRGTGKSTLIEFLRIALRRQDEMPDELKTEFEKYGRTYSNRGDTGLLTNNASIKVIYHKNGSRFRIQWNPAGNLEPIEQEDGGEWHPAEGDIQQRFPIRIYSQKQIFHLAKTPLALLRIVDEAPEVNRRSWAQQWDTEKSRFLSLRAQAREMETGLSEEPKLRGELDDVKRKLAIFEKAGHADILKAFQKKSRQKRTVASWENSWIGSGDQLRTTAVEILPDLLDQTNFDPDLLEDNELCILATKTHGRLYEIRKTIEVLASQTDQIIEEWRKSKDESSWFRTVDAAEKAYKTLQEKLASEGAGDPFAYGKLVQRQQIIEQRLKDLAEQKNQVVKLKEQADKSFQRFLSIRKELTRSRREFLENILHENRFVKIQVIPYGSSENVEEEFRRLLQREKGGFENDIGTPDGEGLLARIYENTDSDDMIEANLAIIKDTIKNIKEQPQTPSLRDQRFATHIRNLPPEVIDRLDLWFPEDSLEVQYSATGNGQHFRSIQEGSPGQKTAALLAFLLSYGEEPLILDQPEDDLDNHLIYDLIVTQLRAVKCDRQIIVVTHNANIVVNGDAELVVALTVEHGETRKKCEGSLQKKLVRNTICSIMEGGQKAFENRYRRIVLEGRHV